MGMESMKRADLEDMIMSQVRKAAGCETVEAVAVVPETGSENRIGNQLG